MGHFKGENAVSGLVGGSRSGWKARAQALSRLEPARAKARLVQSLVQMMIKIHVAFSMRADLVDNPGDAF